MQTTLQEKSVTSWGEQSSYFKQQQRRKNWEQSPKLHTIFPRDCKICKLKKNKKQQYRIRRIHNTQTIERQIHMKFSKLNFKKSNSHYTRLSTG